MGNAERKNLLKDMILHLHKGEAPELVKKRLVELLEKIPYEEVVQAEQELINEGLPVEEVLKLCDIHALVLDGSIDHSGAKAVPEGHPVDVFKKENVELRIVINNLYQLFDEFSFTMSYDELLKYLNKLKVNFNNLMDVDKHYMRKEHLVFPYLEKNNITGPPKVMWGKDDEIREYLKASIEALNVPGEIRHEEIKTMIDILLKPAIKAVSDMIMKEEEILLPMTMDVLTEQDWYEIHKATPDIGFCLYDPKVEWKPSGIELKEDFAHVDGFIRMPTGSLEPKQLIAILKHLPFELTFVDSNDKVRFFSYGKYKVFERNRAIIGRDVRLCHPPSSVHIVNKILDDFKTGRANEAPFWINLGSKFVYIVYYAVRTESGEYLGTLEVVQDASIVRSLDGEQRILSYN